MSKNKKILLWTLVGLSTLTILAGILFFTFDWNKAKPWINHRVSESTGRPFAINGDLTVKWQRPTDRESGWQGWIPWPHVSAQHLTLANPDWVKGAPNMADVGQVSFALVPLSLLKHEVVITGLRLDDASLNLFRQKNGENNWTFKNNPNKDWRLDLKHLEFNKGTVQVSDEVRKAHLKIALDGQNDSVESKYQFGWDVLGTFNGEAIKGGGKAGHLLTLQKSSDPFPVVAEIHVGKTSISLKGTVTKPQDLAALDLYLKVSGANMGQLYPLTGIFLPETPPFATEGRLIGTLSGSGGEWTYDKFKGKVGSSDLSGTFRYVSGKPRPLLTGTLVSNVLQFRDLAPLIGGDSNASKLKRGAEELQPAGKVLPVEPFKTERWTSIDTDVKFTGRKIVRSKELPIDNLMTQIRLKDGVLSLMPLNFGVAGGQLTSNITLDGRNPIIKAQLKVAARHLKLKQLFPAFKPMQASLGEINGDASLSGTGNSVAAILGTANGEVKAVITNGTISKLLLEQMGLNIGNVIMTKMFGDKQVQLNCLASNFKVTDGSMDARTFIMDTDDATLYVTGKINLTQEQFDLKLRPDTKSLRVVSLRAPLYLKGPFSNPDVTVDKGVMALKAGSAVVLGVFAPIAAALLPLVNLGPGKENECAKFLVQAQASTKPVAPPPGKPNATK